MGELRTEYRMRKMRTYIIFISLYVTFLDNIAVKCNYKCIPRKKSNWNWLNETINYFYKCLVKQ